MSKEVFDISYFAQRWEKHGTNVQWQVRGAHPFLVKHIETLTDGKKAQRILVPLCGMSYDLLWLADQGHSVVGVEAVREGIEAFFKANSLEYTVDAINMAPSGAYVYKAKDKDITFFQCDFFHFRKSIAGGEFDAIWDRAALIATLTNTSEEQDVQAGRKYLEVVHNVLKTEGKCLIEIFNFIPSEKVGSGPSYCTPDMLRKMCDSKWKMADLDQLLQVQQGGGFQQGKLEFVHDILLYLLTPC